MFSPPGVTPRVTRHGHRRELSRGSVPAGASRVARKGSCCGGSPYRGPWECRWQLSRLFRGGSKYRRCLRLRETWRGWAMGSRAAGGRDAPTHEHAERVGMSVVSIGKQAKYTRIPACPRGAGAPPSLSPPLWLIQYSHRCKSFHPPSAPASRLHPDRRRKVSGAVRCLPCPGASSLSLWPARPGLGRALFTLARKGISLPCPGSSCWPVRKWGHLTPRSAAWDWNLGAKTQHKAPLISPSP